MPEIPESLAGIITTVLIIIASGTTGIITWLFGRKRSDTEIAKIATDIYTTLVKDLESRVDRQSQTIQEQAKTIQRQDEKYNSLLIYVEKLEALLIDNRIIKRKDLESIKDSIGI